MAIVKLSSAAEIDLQILANYLLDYVSEEATDDFANLIDYGLKQLADNPFTSGYSVLSKKYREFTVRANKKRQYRLLYEYDRAIDTVTIIAVKDAREDRFTDF